MGGYFSRSSLLPMIMLVVGVVCSLYPMIMLVVSVAPSKYWAYWLGVTASINLSGENLGSFLAGTEDWTEQIGYY
jgi:hypothetical protein